jgi:purine-binding chemotaxis protein CheW
MLDTQDYSKDETFEFITFTAGGQNFCLEITKIREIRRWTQVTVLPHTPKDVLGVMNLRGAVIPIFDLAAWFGLGKTKENERNVVIIASVEKYTFGFLVETVSEILSAKKSEIQETPDVKSEATRETLQGVISVGDTMVRVVRAEAVMSLVSDAKA